MTKEQLEKAKEAKKAREDFPLGTTVTHYPSRAGKLPRVGVVVGYNYDNQSMFYPGWKYPILVRWHNEEQPVATFEYGANSLEKVPGRWYNRRDRELLKNKMSAHFLPNGTCANIPDSVLMEKLSKLTNREVSMEFLHD